MEYVSDQTNNNLTIFLTFIADAIRCLPLTFILNEQLAELPDLSHAI